MTQLIVLAIGLLAAGAVVGFLAGDVRRRRRHRGGADPL